MALCILGIRRRRVRLRPGPPPPGVDGPPSAQPGTAFTHDFPGFFPIKEKPDKLEYEILVTSKEGPSPSLVAAVSGQKDAATPFYKPGSNWYFLSNPLVLEKALTESRDQRLGQHAFRNTTTVSISLKEERRYYFLLSPVQLGPEALKQAMANPKGLTPLLKPGENGNQWDPNSPTGPMNDKYVGPTIQDIEAGTIFLPVVDPYAWPEVIAATVLPAALDDYIRWLGIDSKDLGQE